MTAALILSGGKSRRLGRDKSLLKIEDETLIERAAGLLKSIFPEVFISSNEPAKFGFTDLPVIEDIYPNKGPLSGIHSGLVYSGYERIFALAVDMPFVNAETIRFISEIRSDKKVILPRAAGYTQYLCGVYSSEIIAPSMKMLSGGGPYSIHKLLETTGCHLIPVEKLSFYHEKLFHNVNTHEDLEEARKLLGKR